MWKDVLGYEGYYQVSSFGRVRSLDRVLVRRDGRKDTKTGRLISIQYDDRTNIYEVHLSKEGKRKCYKIHRLVAIHYIYNDNPEIKTTVNHKDGDRSNNHYSNLEWASYSENLKHAYDVLNRPTNSASAKHRPCKSIDIYGNERFYNSIAEASRKTSISETQIRRIIAQECNNAKFEFYYT